MRISRLELTNFRTFSHLILEDIPEMVVLVSPNGFGKSSILEAIAGAHDLVAPYQHESYPFQENIRNIQREVWPSHLRIPVKFGSEQASITIEVQPNEQEKVFLKQSGIEETTGKAHFVIQHSRAIVDSEANESIRELFKYHNAPTRVGYFDYIHPIRLYPQQGVGNINEAGSDDQTKQMLSGFHRGLGDVSSIQVSRIKAALLAVDCTVLLGCDADEVTDWYNRNHRISHSPASTITWRQLSAATDAA